MEQLLKQKISSFEGKQLFAPLSQCDSLFELIELYKTGEFYQYGDTVAAYGMLLAVNLSERGDDYTHSIKALNKLSLAKSILDIQLSHSIEVVQTTNNILFSTQSYVDDETIPCTEWLGSKEVISKVFDISKKHLQRRTPYEAL